jgi:hypothetical protein
LTLPNLRPTNSTNWPDFMQTLYLNEAASGISLTTLAEAGIAVLRELEASLLASIRAVLSHDASALELATRDQLRLRRALEILWVSDGTLSRTDGRTTEFKSPVTNEYDDVLRTARLRVLHLGRVQAALLGRERRWMNVLTNMVAGPEANYVRPTAATLISITGRG